VGAPESETGNSLIGMLFGLVLVAVIALFPSSGTEYAGLSRERAVKAAKNYVVQTDYGGDVALFYRNTGNRPTAVRRTRDFLGHQWWFVRFDDFQAMDTSCVTVRRVSSRVVRRATAC
jgi:hypothetical protein